MTTSTSDLHDKPGTTATEQLDSSVTVSADTKHIALLTRQLSMGGIQKIVMKLANEFARRGHRVDIVLTKGAGVVAEELLPDVRVVTFDSHRVWQALPTLTNYLKEAAPDVLLSAEDSSNILSLWGRLVSPGRTRFVVSMHQNTSAYAKGGAMWYNWLIPHLIRIFYPVAHTIISVSAGIKEDLETISRRSARKTEVVYNPVVDDGMLRQAEEPCPHPWFADEEAPVILGVGRLVGEKNFGLLIRAFARVRAERDARLVILGDGDQRVALEREAEEMGIAEHVDLHKFVRNPYTYMANASLLALSSNYEGLPTVLIEALACGCPVVSTDCPNGPCEILEDGKWGALVPVGDEEALAQAMTASLSQLHDRATLRRRGMDFSVEKSVDRYLEVLFSDQAPSE